MTETFVGIADIVIRIKTERAPVLETTHQYRYQHFLLTKRPRRVDIDLDLKILERYKFFKFHELFRTERDTPMRRWARPEGTSPNQPVTLSREEQRYLGGGLDWRIGKAAKKYLIEGGTSGRYQLLINESLTRGHVFMINSKGEWKVTDVVFGFLQVLIIYYLAKHRLGLLFHSSGLWDGNHGYLFSGLSGAGKSTTSRIWDEAPDVRILNDDRIIVRHDKGGLYMYPTPWHGDYSDYLKEGRVGRARLSKLFYIYHRETNLAERVSAVDGFSHFIQALFVAFWDEDCLKFSFDYLLDLFEQKPCYKFGFKNDARIIRYVRNLK